MVRHPSSTVVCNLAKAPIKPSRLIFFFYPKELSPSSQRCLTAEAENSQLCES